MNRVLNLLEVSLIQMFNLNAWKSKRLRDKLKFTLIGVLVVYGICAMLFAMTFFFFRLGKVFHTMGMESYLLTMGYVFAAMIIVFLCIYRLAPIGEWPGV